MLFHISSVVVLLFDNGVRVWCEMQAPQKTLTTALLVQKKCDDLSKDGERECFRVVLVGASPPRVGSERPEGAACCCTAVEWENTAQHNHNLRHDIARQW